MDNKNEIKMMTYDKLSEMSKKYPNDFDFGSNYRMCIIKFGKLDDACLLYPNNSDLGSYLRGIDRDH